jgi:hypothetical protein
MMHTKRSARNIHGKSRQSQVLNRGRVVDGKGLVEGCVERPHYLIAKVIPLSREEEERPYHGEPFTMGIKETG